MDRETGFAEAGANGTTVLCSGSHCRIGESHKFMLASTRMSRKSAYLHFCFGNVLASS